MNGDHIPDELVSYLVRGRGLSAAEARRLVLEVSNYYSESVPEFVARRHHELQRAGLRNAEIYARISAELENQLFRAGQLSERQIRRLVYG